MRQSELLCGRAVRNNRLGVQGLKPAVGSRMGLDIDEIEPGVVAVCEGAVAAQPGAALRWLRLVAGGWLLGDRRNDLAGNSVPVQYLVSFLIKKKTNKKR